MLFLTALESVLSIVLIIALGFYLRHKGYFADSFASNISKLIMNIALPASIFVSVLSHLDRQRLFSLSDGLIYGVIATLLGYFLAWLMTKWLKVRSGRRGVFINTIVNAKHHFHRLTPQYRPIWRQQYALFFGVLCVEHRFHLDFRCLAHCSRQQSASNGTAR